MKLLLATFVIALSLTTFAEQPHATWFDASLYLPRGNGVKLGRPVSIPDPQHSEAARKSKTTGTVVLAVAINANGTVDMVKVLQSVEPGLDQNAARRC